VTGWDPSPLAELGLTGADDDWLGAITMKKTYTSGLVGESVAHFISSGTEASRGYLAAERITGILDDGRSGSFTVHHGGSQVGDDLTIFGSIVAGTGTGDFTGFAGTATIIHDADGAYFSFELTD
jgi:hypothetical protein